MAGLVPAIHIRVSRRGRNALLVLPAVPPDFKRIGPAQLCFSFSPQSSNIEAHVFGAHRVVHLLSLFSASLDDPGVAAPGRSPIPPGGLGRIGRQIIVTIVIIVTTV
jgi:hypothetical protein